MTRTIKSYVLRAGRMSPRQQYGLNHCLPKYQLLPTQEQWCFKDIFHREAQTIIEIGFGMGASLLTMAKAQPAINFIGIEVHQPGLGSLAAEIETQGVDNIRIVNHDAVEIFRTQLAIQSIQGVQIFFPDPWPKKRHHKRRLIQTDFIKILLSALVPDGFIHVATDWEDYAFHILEVLSQEPALYNDHQEGGFSPRPLHRPPTKFEQRGQRLGHGVWDIIFRKCSSSAQVLP